MIKKQLGYVGVDSGQLIITDPCYIDSEWEKKDFNDIRLYRLKKNKKHLFAYENPLLYNIPNMYAELFKRYDTKTSTGKSINEMIETKEIEEIKIKAKLKLIGNYSYAGCCETNTAEKHQLKYRKGHKGVAITFKSGYGDGMYPVYGTFNKEGRCLKVEIDCNITPAQKKFFLNSK